MNGPPSVVQTPGFAHYSLAWSPFHTTRIALASAANFGLVGNGRLHMVSLGPGPSGLPSLKIDKHYETQDGLYDVAWSEIHENQLVTASGDGSIRLWDVMLNDLPIRAWQEHTREVFSVDWSNLKKDTFASSSWDGLVKLWTPERPRSITTLQTHHSCVYQAIFSPHQPDILATCSTDGTLKIFDLRSPAYAPSGPGSNNFTNPLSAAALTVPASSTEVLTLDWNKYRPFVLASGGVDKLVNIWDCRMIKPGELNQVGGVRETPLFGHEYAVRKVQWSPHRAEILSTASYDMTCRVWNTAPEPLARRAQGRSMDDERTELEPTDIFSSSLETLFDYQPITLASAGAVYSHELKARHSSTRATDGPLKVTLLTPDTLSANWSLHASDIWASSRYLADHLDQLGIDTLCGAKAPGEKVKVLELGASAGLPGISIAKIYENVSVVVSDYPDELLIKTLSENVARNGVSDSCRAAPYAWGSDPSSILDDARGFDIVLAADTLWNPSLHTIFISSLCLTLKRSSTARVHLVAGLHTGRYTIQAFLSAVQEAGFDVESAQEKEVKGVGLFEEKTSSDQLYQHAPLPRLFCHRRTSSQAEKCFTHSTQSALRRMNFMALAGLRRCAKKRTDMQKATNANQEQNNVILGDPEIFDLAPVHGLGWDFTIDFVGHQD
ncbi:putative WD40 repeat-like protein [Lyophyllum shimeji]|uniref:Peroxin-7 n=1 Tax=Lyophyllum shimeji TaxID=47721 RepID=A0A9P3UNJ4_LYOSH|nr:putative WD40 repeat-like protein [Lyophyllum shimeji]